MTGQPKTNSRPHPAWLLPGLMASLLTGLTPAPAAAQEANLSLAATQPAKGRITFREQVRFARYEHDDGDTDRWVLNTRLTLGLTGALSAVADVPAVRERGRGPDGEHHAGLGDVSIGLKWRFWQHDTGAIETNRLALTGGVRLPSGADGLSSGGVDPFVGLVFTTVRGRHGLNASAQYLVTTDGRDDPVAPGMGSADLLTLETSYLYRLSPSAYTPETEASLYAVAESFVDYETNGDAEWRIAPGLLYEARRWAAELSVILPVATDVERRSEFGHGFAAGVRILF